MTTDSTLNVATIALDIAPGRVDDNLAAAGRALQMLEPDTDLVVLPELFTTGYIGDPHTMERLAQTNGGTAMSTLAALASQYNMAIAGSFLACTGRHYYNRGFIIEPSGDETFYDKRHLFSLSTEARLYTAGTSARPIVRFRGWNISMMVCYDLRFPVWARNSAQAYDLMLVPANWPHARAYVWEHLLVARAIENQACVIGANRSGTDDYGVYDIGSYIFDAMGNNVGRRLSRRSAPAPIFTARLSLAEVREARKRLPAGDCADNFSLMF